MNRFCLVYFSGAEIGLYPGCLDIKSIFVYTAVKANEFGYCLADIQ